MDRSATVTPKTHAANLTERPAMPENDRSPLSPLKPLGETLLFARNFLRHPNMLGSIIPSSRFLVEQVLGPVDWGRARVIVEYGPGVGTFTCEILRRMRSDAQLVAMRRIVTSCVSCGGPCRIRDCTSCTTPPPRCSGC